MEAMSLTHSVRNPLLRRSGSRVAALRACNYTGPLEPGGYMRTLLAAVLLLFSLATLAQSAPQAEKPGILKPDTVLNEKPLKALPYTPSLDVNAMDKSADPCADFYQYSCGGWMKSNPIPPDQPRWSV